ncbi:autotransporter family protein [Stenotrophomonas tuberculopleuritidis]|uniref:autotransporter family protein n=1 Tax=Stenotrophomonas tuberculopleuritidis TaxID=3055079 RepID=UPI0026E57E0F|nr:autotransporter outer membrane beta-barrel domain-containing protein [Stenotrophomonas sp. 704A1]
MKIAIRRSPALLAPCLLASALLLCLPLPALAGSLVGGQTHDIHAGDPVETWSVQGASTLNILAGGVADATSLQANSTLNVTGGSILTASNTGLSVGDQSQATFNGGTLTNTGGVALSLSVNAGSNIGSSATFIDSSISGVGRAASVSSGSSLSLSNTRVTGTSVTNKNGAITSFGGSLALTNGTHVEGESHGITMWLSDDGLARPGDGDVIIDASSVKATTGSALYVSTIGNGSLDTANIFVRNGATLSGADGNLITVEQGVATTRTTTANFNVESTVLEGNVLVANDGSIGNVTLSKGGRINGVFTGVNQASIGDGGYWQMTGASTVATLNLGSGGTIALGDGSAFHTLNVAGNFSGADGTLLFNTVLAGDDAATDKLIIGGDTSGSANVRVNNVGGAGAQTSQGIQLIQVGGASNGQFTLAGRAVGGQYEYFLHKGTGADGNWYLRSVLPTVPDPCVVDPTLPECTPDPVLRPEPGAYLANLQAAQTMFRVGYHDRHAGQNAGRAWARVDGSRNGFDAISQQLDIRGNSQALTVGADVWRHDSGSTVGVMLSTGNASSTSTNELTGYYARGKVKGEALGIYGTWRGGNDADPYAGFYVDGSLQRAQFRNRVEGIGLADERYNSRAWQGAIETGYAFRVGGASNGGIYLEPQLQVGYSRWDGNRHTEVNGTVVTTEDADGMFGRAGVRLSGVTRWGNGVAEVQPYLAAHWLHTRAESQIRMDDEVVDARIPRSRGEFSGGASVKFGNGIGAWGGLSLQRASGYHQTSAQVGLSYNW